MEGVNVVGQLVPNVQWVEALQHQAAPHGLRRLQEVFGHAISGLPLPSRFTSLVDEGSFQQAVREYIAHVNRWLRLVRLAVRRRYPLQVTTYEEVHLNIGRFEDWIRLLVPFTSLRGLRSIAHHPRCNSRRCLLYGCQFRSTHDEASILVYPDYLYVERNTNNRIVRILHLEFSEDEDWDN